MDEELKNVREVLEEFGEYVREIYRYNLSSEEVNATHNLYNNISVHVKNNGRFYTVSLNLEEYWKYIEYGRGPGKFPPIDEILNWITTKPVIAFENDLGKIPSERSLAFLIGRKIATEGTKGKALLEQSVEEVLEVYYSRLTEAIQKDAGDIVSATIKSGFRGSNFKHITFK